MRYSNQPEREGINAQAGKGEGREFLLLGASFLVAAGLLSLLFVRAGALLGPLMPFAWEAALVPDAAFASLDTGDERTRQRLQTLSNDIAKALDMPPNMAITLHYSKADTVNAFATFGGHMVVFDGLLKKLGSEDAVTALLAHELAHVKHRHVIKGATGTLLANLLWSALGWGGDVAALDVSGFSQLSMLSSLSMTRDMERQADAEALRAVLTRYGHAGGYFALFETLGDIAGHDADGLDMLQTHPDVADRIASAQAQISIEQRSGALTAWP
ncbi:MAG: M48 family metallopeptidase [Pseudomonadota bacterium]